MIPSRPSCSRRTSGERLRQCLHSRLAGRPLNSRTCRLPSCSILCFPFLHYTPLLRPKRIYTFSRLHLYWHSKEQCPSTVRTALIVCIIRSSPESSSLGA